MFRRDCRLFLKCLKSALVIGCIFLMICAAAAVLIVKSEEAGKKPVTLALVNEDTDSTFSGFVLNMIAANENIASAMEVTFFETEEEAVRAVKEGAAAALILPQDFFASVSYGENYPCKIILNNTNLSAAGMISDYAALGSDILSSAQTAIYAGDLCLQEKGADGTIRGEYNLQLNASMVSEVADAPERYFEIENFGYTTKGLSAAAHYAALYLSFFLAVLGICFFHLYRDDCEKGQLIRLFSAGITAKKFIFWKILLPAAFFAILTMIGLPAGRKMLLLNITPAALAAAVCGILFLAFFVMCIGICFGAASGAISFVIGFVSLFLCGGIIPYANLAPWVLQIGKFTPLGVSYSLFSPLLNGGFDFVCLIPAAIYILFGSLAISRTLKQTILGAEVL